MSAKHSQVDPLFLSFQLAVAGRYSIDRELGRGGMGVVYLAREVHLDRMVAIKLLPPDKAADGAVRERFLREARLAARLSHPNIIPIHSVEEAGDFVFYVMAYVNGETLAQRVRTRGPLSSAEATRVLREVAWALGHAHSHGLVHRDVKPDNILLEFVSGRVLVMDFGIASATHETANTRVSGTPEFMSPEQALGQVVDARSDLYSLGITAFYALTGRLPFEGATSTAVLAKQVTEAPPAIASLGIPVARKLALLMDKCVAKDPALRPELAEVLAEQLSAALEQRKEIPAALRAFVKRSGRLTTGGTLFPFVVVTAVTPLAIRFESPAIAFAMGAAIVGGTFGYLVHAARKLMKLGFVYADVLPAFTAELERVQEESAVEHARGASVLEKSLKYVGTGLLGIFGVSFLATMMGIVSNSSILPWTFTIGLTGVPVLFGYLMVVERRRDVDTEFWSKLWKGRIGKAAFWLGRKLLGRDVGATAVTHRATELSLGMAVESLFEGLPADVRRSLGDVPGLARTLQDRAHRLRKLCEEIQDAVEAVGEASFSDEHRALRSDRDRIHGKLGEAVTALETVRLNLLRLHAGSGTVESFTTQMGLASEVSADVERLLAARRDVDRTLIFPRRIATTPA